MDGQTRVRGGGATKRTVKDLRDERSEDMRVLNPFWIQSIGRGSGTGDQRDRGLKGERPLVEENPQDSPKKNQYQGTG
ncbi:unnamed protein product [Peronospora effusa]|nr:unnamed protein product [Peronospora effusa]